jgi:pilus assembly protein Flp/PilA
LSRGVCALASPKNPVSRPPFRLAPDRRSPSVEDRMKFLATKVQRFLVSEEGPTAVEYAVMLALIVIVCLTAIQAIGTNANSTFNSIANALSSTGTSS